MRSGMTLENKRSYNDNIIKKKGGLLWLEDTQADRFVVVKDKEDGAEL